jgi:hypothetical protein
LEEKKSVYTFFIVQLEAKRSVGRLVCRWEVTKLSWGLCTMGSSQAVGFVTEFKHIKKHVFVRMGKKCMPASGSSTLPRRAVP